MAELANSITITDTMTASLMQASAASQVVSNAFASMQTACAAAFSNTQIRTARSEIEQVGTALTEGTNSGDGISDQISKINSNMEGMAEKAKKFMASFGADTLKNAAVEMYQMGTALQATENKYNSVFAGMTGTADSFLADFQKLTPATTATARTMAMGIQGALTPMGIAGEEAAKMTGETMHLVGALSNFNSAAKSPEEVAQAFQSAYSGDYEALGSLGIQADESSVKETAVNMGLAGNTDEVTRQMEAQALLQLAYSQSADALAAYNEEALDTNTRMQLLQTGFQDTFAKAGQSLLPRVNEFLEVMQGYMPVIQQGVYLLADAFGAVMDGAMAVYNLIAENWPVIGPIILGIAGALAVFALYQGIQTLATWAQTAATWAQATAQKALNTAMNTCPIVWIIALIMVVIGIIYAVCEAIARVTGVADSGFGVICGGLNVVMQFFKNLGLEVANIALGIGYAVAAVATNIMTAFHNAICSVQSWWYGLLSTVLTVVAGICEALNKIPFIEFDYSGITSAANEYAEKSAQAEADKEEYTNIADAFHEGMSTFDTFQKGWASNAFSAGADWGDGAAGNISGTIPDFFNTSKEPANTEETYPVAEFDDAYTTTGAGTVADSTASTADSASAISDSVDITNENLRYLRDAAEAEAINRFTTAAITINQTNHNTVSSDTDIDGMVACLTEGMNQAMEQAGEGVHN